MGRHKKEPRPCSNPACDKIITTRKLCARCQKRKQRGRLESKTDVQIRQIPIQPRPLPGPYLFHVNHKFPSDTISAERLQQQKTLERVGMNAIQLLPTLPQAHPLRILLTNYQINSFVTPLQNIDELHDWAIKTSLNSQVQEANDFFTSPN